MNMIRWMRTLLVTFTLSITLMIMTWDEAAIAADIEIGAKVFNANCAACHMGGGNNINPAKTLKQEVGNPNQTCL